ncbi:universal stress protein [Glaciihabitans sp. dw_435]|uniref:universal stress protein n=1 Tax=Glaciihabitans sp. dw_435 TaxID=2720081 RepID=UPI001BD5AF3C|nr:universal stress protein [Glaciihabitans sp. dw_435]
MEKIIIAVDGEPSCEAAIGWVIERSRRRPTSVEVTTVAELATYGGGMMVDDVEAAYSAVVREAVERISTASPTTTVTSRVRRGQVRVELARASEDADVIVLGTARHRTVEHGGYGALPARIATVTDCPVIVIPQGWVSGDAGPVVLGIDVQHPQPGVESFAAREAAAAGGVLRVVHAWGVPTWLAVVLFAHPSVWREVGETVEEKFADHLTRIRRDRPALIITELLREGPTSRVVEEEAAGAQLLVLGRKAHGSMRDYALGSTAHDALIAMPCPVAIVPA